MANAERLYDCAAFIVKMIALMAGIILTYGASRPVARADGEVGPGAQGSGCSSAGLCSWLGLWVFATGDLINVGLFHLITAAALIVLIALQGRAAMVYLAGLLLLIGVRSSSPTR